VDGLRDVDEHLRENPIPDGRAHAGRADVLRETDGD
jgi:hypothetical protein